METSWTLALVAGGVLLMSLIGLIVYEIYSDRKVIRLQVKSGEDSKRTMEDSKQIMQDATLTMQSMSDHITHMEDQFNQVTSQFSGLGFNERVKFRQIPDRSYTVMWCQPFFLPHESYLQGNMDVIQNLLEYGSKHHTKVIVNACGYAYNNEFFQQYEQAWNEAKKKAEEEKLNVTFGVIERLDHNYGQAACWNRILERHVVDQDFDTVILTGCDGTIPTFHKDILAEAAVVLEEHPDIGLVSYNLRGYHLSNASWQRETFVMQPSPYDELRLLYSGMGGGVAGSISMLSKKAMQVLNYHVISSSVYCPDDAYTHEQLRNANLYVVILANRFIGHGEQACKSDEAFQKWKHESLTYGAHHMTEDASHETLLDFAVRSEVIFDSWNK